MLSAETLGFVAACFTTGSFLPQAIKVIKTRDTASLSLMMYLAFNLGVMMWLIYGVLRKDNAIILANVVTLVLSMLILSIKIVNVMRKRDKWH